MIDTLERPALPAQQARDEQYLGVAIRIEPTDQADERLHFRAVVTGLAVEVAGLAVGDVLGWGKTPARCRRRATDKIANRRRGPVRSQYLVHGVTFRVGPNRDDQAPAAHAFLAVVTAVDQASPLRAFINVGQTLARKPNGANTADRAYLVLGQLAERARADAEQQKLVAEGAQLALALAGRVLPEPASTGEWDDPALCRQVDPDLFFPDQEKATTQQAVAICVRCPVRDECLARALDQGERFGVWGGSSEAQRRDLKRIGITGDVARVRSAAVVLGMVVRKRKARKAAQEGAQGAQVAAA
jgi:WhiB family redox-sensing transcriptional regulator